jgi:DNA-binding GntR family transcriptional regulator
LGSDPVFSPEEAAVPVRPIQIASVVDQVHAALREQILSGELERGSRLPQETLAAEFGVSRTPLREALRRLAAEGLVTLQPNYGATVSQLDFGDMRDAWTARLVIEPPAARMGAERRPEPELDRMQAAIDHQRAVGDPAASLDANRDFHLALVAASGNPHLIHLAELLWVARISVAIYTAQAAQVGGTAAWSDEHDGILAAMRAGDGDAAERLTREHIERHPPVAQER